MKGVTPKEIPRQSVIRTEKLQRRWSLRQRRRATQNGACGQGPVAHCSRSSRQLRRRITNHHEALHQQRLMEEGPAITCPPVAPSRNPRHESPSPEPPPPPPCEWLADARPVRDEISIAISEPYTSIHCSSSYFIVTFVSFCVSLSVSSLCHFSILISLKRGMGYYKGISISLIMCNKDTRVMEYCVQR